MFIVKSSFSKSSFFKIASQILFHQRVPSYDVKRQWNEDGSRSKGITQDY